MNSQLITHNSLTLGIETSCDETSCAVLRNGGKVLSNIISSSLFRHKAFGGVVPEIASRHSLEQIDTVFKEALSEAKVKPSQLGLVAVTCGPGLIGSLLVGVTFAKSIAYSLGIPLIGVNHLDAHLVANFIEQKEPPKYLGLLVSGGHTMISFHQKGKVAVLGQTIDDAVGEAYDKVAKMMGLGFPGGPVIDKLAKKGDPKAVCFTNPKVKNPLDFSFSGIKTAVLYHLQKQKPSVKKSKAFICDMAASFQEAAVSWLVQKTLRAAESKKVKHIVIGGGVSANSELRKRLTEQGEALGFQVLFPPFSLTVDNAAMIARRGYQMAHKKIGKIGDSHQFPNKRRKLVTVTNFLKLTGIPNLKMGLTK